MNPQKPVFACIALIVSCGVSGCFEDNPPAYQYTEETLSSRVESDDDAGQANDGPGALIADPGDDPDGDEADSGVASGMVSQPGDAGDLMSSPDGSMMTQAGDQSGNDAGRIVGGPMVDPDSPFYPPCYLTLSQSGEEIKKGTPCTSEDPPLCYRPCGPRSVGWKTEQCLAGVYAEGDCTFPPDADYACFAIPDQIDTGVCPTNAPPKATDECDVPGCTLCNLNGQYFDTGDNAKDGYCICRLPEEDPEGIRRWTCASETAWPCPFNRGC